MNVLYRMYRCLVVLFLLVLYGCATSSPQADLSNKALSKLNELNSGQGLLEGRMYHYPSMDLTLTLPESWSLKKSDKTFLTIDGAKSITVLDSVMQSQEENKVFQLFHLLSQSKNENGVIDPILAVIVSEGLAKKVNQLSDEQVMSIYSFGIKQRLRNDKNIHYSFSRKGYIEEFSGVKFDVLPTDITVAGMNFHQDYYSTYANGQIVTFISTYGEQVDRKRLEEIVQSVSFVQKSVSFVQK